MLLAFDVASSEAQFVIMWFSMGITCLVYAVLTIFGLRNFFKYIVKQQYQLKLLYVLAILAAAGRMGRYIAMVVNLIRGSEMHTQMQVFADLVISCLLVGVGLCLSLIMFKLHTYLHCWSIYLHQQRQHFNNQERLRETREEQTKASRRFVILKYALHATMVLVTIFILTQVSLIYARSDYSKTNPMKVSALDFVQSQEVLPWYSVLNMRMVFIEQGAFFFCNAMLLYTSIFYLVSIMSDLGQQNHVMYVEGSSSLESEKKRIKIIMVLFGSSYVLRAGFDMAIGIYLAGFSQLAVNYPGFFELLQSLYFILTDLVPIGAFFWMHNQVYGVEEGQQQQQQVQMQVNPDAARAYHLQNNNAQYLQTVLLNILETNSSAPQSDTYDSGRQDSSNGIHDSFSLNDGSLYQEGFGTGGFGRQTRQQDESEEGISSQLRSRKNFTLDSSVFEVPRIGLLSLAAARQIHSDIVTVETLSRLQASEIDQERLLDANDLVEEEIKGEADDLYHEQLLPDEERKSLASECAKKSSNHLSGDVVDEYNKLRNHFSKSTAESADINVKDLERLMGVRDSRSRDNQRFSGMVDDMAP